MPQNAGATAQRLTQEDLALLQGGAPAAAASRFSEALEADPQYASALRYRAEAYRKLGSPNEAEKDLAAYWRLKGLSESAIDERLANRAGEEDDEKKPWLATLLNVFPIPLGLGYFYLGRYAKACLTLLGMAGAAVAFLVIFFLMFAAGGFDSYNEPTYSYLVVMLLVAAVPTAILAAWVGGDASRIARQKNSNSLEPPARDFMVTLAAGAWPIVALSATIAAYTIYFNFFQY